MKIYVCFITYKDSFTAMISFVFCHELLMSFLSTIYKMSGSLSVYKDTSASHEYLCTLIKSGHEFCKLITSKTHSNSRSMKLHLKIKC